jgi:methyl-accepting chemotaxis protein
MHTTFQQSYTIAEFQQHLENTQKLLIETKALTEEERNDFASHLAELQLTVRDFKDNGEKLGVIDSMFYNIGWGWENTALHKTKDNALTLGRHIMPLLKTLQQKMTTNARKYSEMYESVTFMSRNFQSLIDSNRLLANKVDSLEAKVTEQSQKLSEQSQKLSEQSQKLSEQSQKIDSLTTQNQQIIDILKGMQSRESFVTTQNPSSFVSYVTTDTTSPSFITSLD